MMNSSTFPALLYPGLKKTFGLAYNSYPVQFTQVFDMESSDKKTEFYQEEGGLGTFQATEETQPINLDKGGEGYQTALTNIDYTLGFEITKNMINDDQYRTIMKFSTQLGVSAQQTREIVAANILNNAFSTSFSGSDGKPLCSPTHVVALTGGTYPNAPLQSLSLSETSLRYVKTAISRLVDARGKRILAMGEKLIVPVALQDKALKLTESELEYETFNNAINPYKGGRGLFPKGVVVLNFLSSDVAWYIRTNIAGLIYQKRQEIEFFEDDKSRTLTRQYFAHYRDAFGWYDPRSIWGTEGL